MRVDQIISYSKSIKEPHMRRRPLGEVLDLMQTDRMRQLCERLSKTQGRDRTEFKANNLPWFSLATFREDMAYNDNLESVPGLVLDFDELPAGTTSETLRDRLSLNPFVAVVFVSPSRKGVKVVIEFDQPVTDQDTYLRYWFSVTNYFYDKFGLANDRSTKDVRRACYLSYDTDLRHNIGNEKWFITQEEETTPEAKSIPIPIPAPKTRDDLDQQVQSACEFLSGSLSYPDWIKAGFALAAHYGAFGLPYFQLLSLSPRYPQDTPDTLTRRFENFVNTGRKTSIETLFYYANSAGWSWKRKSASVSPARTTETALRKPEVVNNDDIIEDEEPFIIDGPLSTDRARAEQWAQYMKGSFIYSSTALKWLFWNGRYWEIDEKGKSWQSIIDFARYLRSPETFFLSEEAKKSIKKIALSMENNKEIKKMLESAQSIEGTSCCASDFDKNQYLLNCTNGTLDLISGELRPHRKDDLITRQVTIKYDPDAQCPTFHNILKETLVNYRNEPDLDLIEFFQCACGYTLSGDTGEQALFFLNGEGQNGKSVLIRTLYRIMGDYGCKVPSSLLMAQTNNPGVDIASLVGLRFAMVGEIPEGRKLMDSLTKDLTGGDPLQANAKYQNPFTFIPTFKLWVCGNHRPRLGDTGHGMMRRFKIIPCLHRVPDEKKIPLEQFLQDVIEPEIEGILAWMVEGFAKWRQHGLVPVESMEVARVEYRRENDVVARFIDEAIESLPGRDCAHREAYEAYRAWSQQQGELAMTSHQLLKQMRDLGYSGSRTWPNGRLRARNQFYWNGLTVNDEYKRQPAEGWN